MSPFILSTGIVLTLTPGLGSESVPAKLKIKKDTSVDLKNIVLSGSSTNISLACSNISIENKVANTDLVLGAEISYDGGTTYFNVGSSSNKLYVTYGSPVGALTQKRIEWCTTKANNLSTPGGIADAIWGAVATGTTFGNQNTDGWALLDGGSGDCDNQARLMSYVVKLLGISPANVRLVYASTNAGAGNCLSLESRVVGSQTHYLIMDFDTGSGYGWNAYEGSCETAGAYYAITPKKKADNDYEMLKSINCQQYWVRTNVPPGSASGWTVLEVFEEVPKP